MKTLGLITLDFVLFYLLGELLLHRFCLKNLLLKTPWHFFMFSMLFWSCISTALSDNPMISFRGTTYRFDGLESYFFYASVYICALLVSERKQGNLLLPLFTGVANVVSLILLLQEAQLPFIVKCFTQPRASVFLQFNHTGYYLCMSILCLAGLYCYSTARSFSRMYYLVSRFTRCW